jgi:N-methylhydantoinase A/oxoprolinase/acetone carboxylase beta subunit
MGERMGRRFRIGIDVGGTFTHAVAIDHDQLQLVGQAKVLTTHTAPGGVAEGVAQAMMLLLQEAAVAPPEVHFIAHSTTQATNALLEGDVATVGILAIGSGLQGRAARMHTDVGDIPLASGRVLHTLHTFLDADSLNEDTISRALGDLLSGGAAAVVAAEAFSVDDPAREQQVMRLAVDMGLPCTGTHEVSGLYGLRVRTRTAVVNACILPRMLQTAEMTEKSVLEAGITAPLMVMRSDGGVMTAAQMRRRPILTILSGPAAGVAAALMYVRASNAVFMEVGGTSTDICLIRFGQAGMRTASVAGHRLFLRTLDVHTIGVAGGSMPRIARSSISDVGPRSAHLAGLPYCAFTEAARLSPASVKLISPVGGDPPDYAILAAGDRNYAITLTCAANAAGALPEGDYSSGLPGSASAALDALGAHLRTSAQNAARQMIRAAAGKAAALVRSLLAEAQVEAREIVLVGGGGGAGVLVPAVAEMLDMEHRIAENAPVISAIGVALALVRESVERTIPRPSPEDLLAVRREAESAATSSGAAPDTVEVQIEVDGQRSTVRAIATGATEMRSRDLSARALSPQEQQEAAAKILGAPELREVGATEGLRAFAGQIIRLRLFGLWRAETPVVLVVDRQGIVRLRLHGAVVRETTAGEAGEALASLLDETVVFTDAGPVLPQVFLAMRSKIVNLSGLLTAEQVKALASTEIGDLVPQEMVLLLVGRRVA